MVDLLNTKQFRFKYEKTTAQLILEITNDTEDSFENRYKAKVVQVKVMTVGLPAVKALGINDLKLLF